jgi:transcriptional regulator with XRE-family HTH domain
MDKIKHFNHNRINKTKMWAHGIPEHSLDCFADSLSRIIKASGITQKELSKALRCSNTTIANYCDGTRRKPEPKFIQEISDFFDVKPSYFREYRMYQLCKRIENNPELIDVFLDIATSPARIINEWNKIQKDINKYNFAEE